MWRMRRSPRKCAANAATNPPWRVALDDVVEAGYGAIELGPIRT